jgi:hypothetical protein
VLAVCFARSRSFSQSAFRSSVFGLPLTPACLGAIGAPSLRVCSRLFESAFVVSACLLPPASAEAISFANVPPHSGHGLDCAFLLRFGPLWRRFARRLLAHHCLLGLLFVAADPAWADMATRLVILFDAVGIPVLCRVACPFFRSSASVASLAVCFFISFLRFRLVQPKFALRLNLAPLCGASNPSSAGCSLSLSCCIYLAIHMAKQAQNIHPEFANYAGDSIKQADVILLGFPLGGEWCLRFAIRWEQPQRSARL